MTIERILATDTTGLLAEFNAVAVQAASKPAVITAIAQMAADGKKRQFQYDEGDRAQTEQNIVPLAARETALSIVDIIEQEVPGFKKHKNNFVELYQHKFRGGVQSATVLLNDWIVEATKKQVHDNQMDHVVNLMSSHCTVTLTLNYKDQQGQNGLLARRNENFKFKQALNPMIPMTNFS